MEWKLILSLVPVAALVVSISTTVITAAREWGWKRRGDLRNELLTFAATAPETRTVGKLKTTPKATATAAAQVFSLELAEAARRRAVSRYTTLQLGPWWALLWRGALGLLFFLVGVVGLVSMIKGEAPRPDMDPAMTTVAYIYFVAVLGAGGMACWEAVTVFLNRRAIGKAALATIDLEALKKALA